MTRRARRVASAAGSILAAIVRLSPRQAEIVAVASKGNDLCEAAAWPGATSSTAATEASEKALLAASVQTVAVGELDLIASFEELLGPSGERLLRGPGDDASVVRARGFAVMSIDAVTDGTHFTLDTHSPADVGHKALATALSDIAAMGAEAGEAHVALALPRGFEPDAARALVGGMAELAARLGVSIAGGDVITANCLTVTVCVTGWVDDDDPRRRPRRRAAGRRRVGHGRAGRLRRRPAAAGRGAARCPRPRTWSRAIGDPSRVSPRARRSPAPGPAR